MIQESGTDSTPEFLYSDFGDDPDLSELVALFVDEMPERISQLKASLEDKDWTALGSQAHQIKGAAGSYGFDAITPFAADLEKCCRLETVEDQILAACEQLMQLLGRVKAVRST